MEKQRIKLGKEIHRLDIAIGRCLHQMLSDEEVTCTHGRIIRFLSEHEDKDVYQRDLEKEFGITRSTASRVLMLMEQKGLIIRSGVSHDARLKKVTLTPKARGLSDTMHRNGATMDGVLLRGFSDEEAEAFLRMLERMQNNVADAGRAE